MIIRKRFPWILFLCAMVNLYSQTDQPVVCFLGIKAYGETESYAKTAERLFLSVLSSYESLKLLDQEQQAVVLDKIGYDYEHSNQFAAASALYTELEVERIFLGTTGLVGDSYILDIQEFNPVVREVKIRSRMSFKDDDELSVLVSKIVFELVGDKPVQLEIAPSLNELVSDELQSEQIPVETPQVKKWLVPVTGGVGLAIVGQEDQLYNFLNMKIGLLGKISSRIYLGASFIIATDDGFAPLLEIAFENKNGNVIHKFGGFYLPMWGGVGIFEYTFIWKYLTVSLYSMAFFELESDRSSSFYIAPQIGYTFRF